MAALRAVTHKLRGFWVRHPDGEDAARARYRRRRKLLDLLIASLPRLSCASVILGYLYLLALPSSGLGRNTYLSENAIQPAQVNTYWNWGEVHICDRLAEDIVAWDRRADAVKAVFAKHGLRAETQAYAYRLGVSSNKVTLSGINTHAVMRTAKTGGSESIVLSASWRSRDAGRLNVRGIATLLTLSKYLSKLSVWSKDIVFVISDGYVDGMQAWLSAWHGEKQGNLVAAPIRQKTGSIWAALNIDYPHHSFSHLGVFFEAANGLLPNLDFVNTAIHIARWAGGVQVRLHSDDQDLRQDRWRGSYLDSQPVKEYERAAKNIVSQVHRQATGSPSGPEGVFARYRIDALTLFAVPAEGPHGFYAIGKCLESTLRSMNNLLERFHQSFFLYLLSTPDTFSSVAHFLAAPLLVSVGLTLRGLYVWTRIYMAGLPRPITRALSLIVATHIQGCLHLAVWSNLPTDIAAKWTSVIALSISTPTLVWFLVHYNKADAELGLTLHCFNVLLGGIALAIVSTLNFSLGVFASFCLGGTLLLAKQMPPALLMTFAVLTMPASIALWGRVDLVGLLWEWQILGTWFLPFALVVVTPLLAQCSAISQRIMSLDALQASLADDLAHHTEKTELQDVKRELMKQGLLVPSSGQSQADLRRAADLLESAAFLAARAQRTTQFESFVALLTAFEALPATAMKSKLIALQLVLLLSRNEIGAFHTQMERLCASEPQIMDKVEIGYVVEMERCLMEGSYSKVWQMRQAPPIPEFKPFLDDLMTTIRNEIASCGEKAYTVLPIADAATLLFFTEMKDLMQFAQKRTGWTINPTSQTISFGSQSSAAEASDAPRAMEKSLIMENALGYARELEQIV